MSKEQQITNEMAKNLPAGGAVVGKRDGQDMIFNDASLGGYFVGKLHKEGGIKMVNKTTGQPLEVQGSEVIITAPAVADPTKRMFEGKMMTNREILSKINEDGGGVSFADGGEVPSKLHASDCSYEFGGHNASATDVAQMLGFNSTLKDGGEVFSLFDKTYFVKKAYDLIQNKGVKYKVIQVPTYDTKNCTISQSYKKTISPDYKKPQGIMVRLDNGEDVLIDGNHRMDKAHDEGVSHVNVYYISNPSEIAKFSQPKKYFGGGYNKDVLIETQSNGAVVNTGGLSDGFTFDDIAKLHGVTKKALKAQYDMGLKVEKEHFSSLAMRKKIVLDHLVENPKYYTQLKAAKLRKGGNTAYASGGKITEKNYKTIENEFLSLTNQKNYQGVYDSEYFSDGLKLDWGKYGYSVSEGEQDNDFSMLSEACKVFNKKNKDKYYAFLDGGDKYNTVRIFDYDTLATNQRFIEALPDDFFNKFSIGREKNPIVAKRIAEKLEKEKEAKKAEALSEKLGVSTEKANAIISSLSWHIGDNKKNDDFHLSSDLPFKKNKFHSLQELSEYIESKEFADTLINIKTKVEKVDFYSGHKHLFSVKFNKDGFLYLENGEQGYGKRGYVLEVMPYYAGNISSSTDLSKKLKDVVTLFSKAYNLVVKGNLTPEIEKADNFDDLLKLMDSDVFAKGGRVGKESLVKDAKDGNTPARDLNNYNDLLDVQADGDVGGDTGLAFADGGSVGSKSKLVILEASKPRIGLGANNLVDKEYTYIYDLTTDLTPFTSADKSQLRFDFFDKSGNRHQLILAFSNKRNTTQNFNPITGNGQDFVKAVKGMNKGVEDVDFSEFASFASPYSSKGKGRYTTEGLPEQGINKVTSITLTGDLRKDRAFNYLLGKKYFSLESFVDDIKQTYDSVKKIAGFRFDVNTLNGSVYGLYIYLKDQKNTKKNFNIETGTGAQFYNTVYNMNVNKKVAPLDFSDFISGANQAATSATPLSIPSQPIAPTSQKDFKEGKIWIGDNPELSRKVQRALFEKGFGWSRGNEFKVQYTGKEALYFSGGTILSYSQAGRQYFEDKQLEEYFPEDFGITSSGATTPSSATPSTTQSQPPVPTSQKDFKEGKIWIGDNPELSRKVQRALFEKGKSWGGEKKVIYSKLDSLYFGIGDISYENSGRYYFDNNAKKEYFPEDFGITSSGATNTSAPTPSTTQSQPLVPTSQKDFIEGKIWIGDNPELSEKVQKALFEKGFSWSGGEKRVKYTDKKYITFWDDKELTFGDNMDQFLSSSRNIREYFPEDFGIVTQSPKKDFTKGKILIGDNPELSKKVQKALFDMGFDWTGEQEYQYTDKEALYFEKGRTLAYSDVDFFNDDKSLEYFPEDFGIYDTEPSSSKPQVVPKNTSVSKTETIKDASVAISELEKAGADLAKEYNTPVYDEALELLKSESLSYQTALTYTPEAAYPEEKLKLLKNIAENQSLINSLTDMREGGAFFVLSKIIEKLEAGEDWKKVAKNISTNDLPESEIERIIRTERFKNWFGDWETALLTGDNEYVSKAVISGKPIPYWHGATRLKYSYRGASNYVMYLAENRSYAEWFSLNAFSQNIEGNFLSACFVNIKNPIDLTVFEADDYDICDIIRYIDAVYPLANIYDFMPPMLSMQAKAMEQSGMMVKAWNLIRNFKNFNKYIKENTNYDGFIYYENNPSDMVVMPNGEERENITKAVAIFNSNQVKLVDAVLFDGSLDDWRFEFGGNI